MVLLMLVGPVSIVTLPQQEIHAQAQGCDTCVLEEDDYLWLLTTAQFENDLIKAIGDPNENQDPNQARQQHLVMGFVHIKTGQFKKDVVNAIRIGERGLILGLLDTYTQEPQNKNKLLGGPDTFPELITDYKFDVARLLFPR